MAPEKKLSSNYTVPVVGFGTAELDSEEILLPALEAAYETGYRHIDTASMYKNEKIIGGWLKNKPRNEIFITTKLWMTDYDDVAQACRNSMDRLGVDYIDLYLVHWPVCKNGNFELEKLWRDMEALVGANMVRSIGVANFGMSNLTKILSFCKIRPAMLQIELHAHNPQDELREFCAKHGIAITCYSPLGSKGGGSLREDATVTEVAERNNTSAITVLLSYCVALGCCVIPRSGNPEHVRSNFKIIDLSAEDLVKLRSIKKRQKFVDHVSFGVSRYD